MATKKQILESDELLQQKKRAYHLSDEGFEEYKKFLSDPDHRKPNTGMIDQYMDYIKFINDNVDEEEKIVYDTILMIGDASGKEGQFSDSDKKTAENFGLLSFTES